MQNGLMVERVAKALAAEQARADWRTCIEAARSAIAVMREPSTDMLESAAPGLPDWGTLPDDWRAMIDHALSARRCSTADDIR
jgi:hypothetical protein